MTAYCSKSGARYRTTELLLPLQSSRRAIISATLWSCLAGGWFGFQETLGTRFSPPETSTTVPVT